MSDKKEKKLAKKEAKREKKLNKGPMSETKRVIMQCAAVLICALIVCYTLSSVTSTIADAYKKSASVETQGEAGSSEGDDSASVGGDVGSQPDVDTPTDGSENGDVTDPTDADSSSTGTDTSSQTNSSNSGTKTTTTTKKATDTKGPKSNSIADIVSYYNTAANQVKPSAKSVKRIKLENGQVSEPTIGNSATLKRIAGSLIDSNMGIDKKKTGKTYTTAADKKANFTVSGQDWASKLTADNVKSATATKSGGTYTVVITLKPDSAANLKAGGGNAGKGISLITKESIVEGAGSMGMAVIKEDSIKVSHSNVKITAKIDEATGRLTAADYYFEWKLQLTALSIDVSVSFSNFESFAITW